MSRPRFQFVDPDGSASAIEEHVGALHADVLDLFNEMPVIGNPQKLAHVEKVKEDTLARLDAIHTLVAYLRSRNTRHPRGARAKPRAA